MTTSPLEPRTQARVLLPFMAVTLIWGSTWLVIRDQLGTVPPTWSVSYRFAAAALALFVWALVTRAPLRLDRAGHLFAFVFGLLQFVLNFNFVYRAEAVITSGLVAVVYALLLLPNALFGRLLLGQGLSRRFLAGSMVAMVGVVLLFLHELAVADAGSRAVLTGIAITLCGVLCASLANVMQGTQRARSLPMAGMLGWGMVYGAAINALIALLTNGPPVVEPRLGYVLGILYLGVFGSALAFTLYFGVIRVIGPARAAYSSVLTPVLAMALSTLFEGYRWSALAAAGGALALFGLVVALKARSPSR